jgi:hypothetical protein
VIHQLPSMDGPLCCTIRSGGTLDPSWSDRLGGMGVRPSTAEGHPVTRLSGQLPDQAALLGVLSCLYNLGLPLISVACRAVRGDTGGETARPRQSLGGIPG